MSELLIFTLREFAEFLGWRGLQTRTARVDDRIITWYETTDEKFHLQINPEPVGDQSHFMATIIATRYGIPLDAVGFHNFNLEGGEDSLKHRAEELCPTFGRQNFKCREWRKRLLGAYSKQMAEHGHGMGWPSNGCKLCVDE